MTQPGFESKKPWWEDLTEDEARDPMLAIYNAQIVIAYKEDEVDTLKRALVEHNARLEFLRGIVRIRMGLEE